MSEPGPSLTPNQPDRFPLIFAPNALTLLTLTSPQVGHLKGENRASSPAGPILTLVTISAAGEDPEEPKDLASTADLFRLARSGDRIALNHLYQRMWGVLLRVAHGRLPKSARGLADTQDIVQNAMVSALKVIDTFEPQYPGAFLVYLRRCVINEVSNQVRKANRRPSTGLTDDIVSSEPSPDEEYKGTRVRECYEHALTKMSDEDQQIIIEKVEMGFSYGEIAAMHHVQVNAARMRVARALVRLAEVMRKLGHGK